LAPPLDFGDDGRQQMGDAVVADHFDPFGVYHDEFEVVGAWRINKAQTKQLMATDLPRTEYSRLRVSGMRSIPATMGDPKTSLPNGKRNLAFGTYKFVAFDDIAQGYSRNRRIGDFDADHRFAGDGGFDTDRWAASASAKSLSRVVILLTLTPTAGCNSYWVTAGRR
jgi:hypothetical protein